MGLFQMIIRSSLPKATTLKSQIAFQFVISNLHGDKGNAPATFPIFMLHLQCSAKVSVHLLERQKIAF